MDVKSYGDLQVESWVVSSKTNLKDVSSLRLPFSSSSEPAPLTGRLLLAARDGGAELGLEDAGEAFFDLALRETVFPLSRA